MHCIQKIINESPGNSWSEGFKVVHQYKNGFFSYSLGPDNGQEYKINEITESRGDPWGDLALFNNFISAKRFRDSSILSLHEQKFNPIFYCLFLPSRKSQISMPLEIWESMMLFDIEKHLEIVGNKAIRTTIPPGTRFAQKVIPIKEVDKINVLLVLRA